MMQQTFTDLSSLDAIRQKGRENSDEALEDIAKQFESMLVRMMLKSMRDANEVFSKNNPLSSNEGKMYEQMYDDQLALSLSVGRGMGIAEVMVRQLQEAHGTSSALGSQRDQQTENWRKELPFTSMESVLEPVSPAQKTTELQESAPIKFNGSVADFVQQLYPMAEKAARELAADPAVLIAQAALETGWGEKITQGQQGSSNNLFNIKADQRWQGDAVQVNTLEFKEGVAVQERAAFRAYNSLSESFNDYVNFIKGGERYSEARQAKDSEGYIRKLSEAGYATDPNYADKVLNIVNSQSMQAALSDVTRDAGSF